ncbi:MAG: L-erythro-3,5-diaminohexanoate dehydrogenase [Propionibacteriaceae bacterium]
MAAPSGIGLNRVVSPQGVLPQAAEKLDALAPLNRDEIAISVERLNIDAASFTQIHNKHGGQADAIRAEVLEIITTRGKMHNPVTGSGGMLIGTVTEVGPDNTLGLVPGDRVATLVSLTLTPLRIDDELRSWDGQDEQIPCSGRAILFGRTIAAKLPKDLSAAEALAVMDVCGAPALTSRWVKNCTTEQPIVAVIGGAGKSGCLSLAAAKDAGAITVAVVPVVSEYEALTAAKIADHVVMADARNPIELSSAVIDAVGREADITVVCVNVSGCEGGAILATTQGGVIIFFSMATHFASAALGAEGLASDVTMLIGNGYVPGHADFALDTYRRHQGVQQLFNNRFHKEA